MAYSDSDAFGGQSQPFWYDTWVTEIVVLPVIRNAGWVHSERSDTEELRMLIVGLIQSRTFLRQGSCIGEASIDLC